MIKLFYTLFKYCNLLIGGKIMQEMYQKNFIDVLKNEYAEFNGRKNRRDYWMYVLCVLLVNLALGILASIFQNIGFLAWLFNALSGLFGLAVLVPSLGMCVRRLHDIDKDWPWILVALIPFVGWIWLIVLLATDSQKSENQFGPYVG